MVDSNSVFLLVTNMRIDLVSSLGHLAPFLVLIVINSRSVETSRLDREGEGSPCYEVDEQGIEDLTKPQVGG